MAQSNSKLDFDIAELSADQTKKQKESKVEIKLFSPHIMMLNPTVTWKVEESSTIGQLKQRIFANSLLKPNCEALELQVLFRGQKLEDEMKFSELEMS